MVVLYAAEGDARFERVAARRLGRLIAERPELTIQEIQFAAAALQGMPTRPDSALRTLTELSAQAQADLIGHRPAEGAAAYRMCGVKR